MICHKKIIWNTKRKTENWYLEELKHFFRGECLKTYLPFLTKHSFDYIL